MSNSTPRACLPAINRRPSISVDFMRPMPRTRATISQRPSSVPSVSGPLIAARMRNVIAMAANCEPIASSDETNSDHLYGRRNPSRRRNVVRCRGTSGTFEI
jgi:hypothetical protein